MKQKNYLHIFKNTFKNKLIAKSKYILLGLLIYKHYTYTNNKSLKNESIVSSNIKDSTLNNKFEVVIYVDNNNLNQKELIKIINKDLLSDLNINVRYCNKELNNDTIEFNKMSSNFDTNFLNTNIPDMFIIYDNYIAKVNLKEFLHNKKKLKENFNNFFNRYNIDTITELRHHLKILYDNPLNSVYITTQNNSYFKDIYGDFRSKVLIIKNKNLIEKLKLNNSVVYEYCSPLLPNKLNLTSLINFLNNKEDSYVSTFESLYTSKNSSFLINYNLFRNELKPIINNHIIDFNINNYLNSSRNKDYRILENKLYNLDIPLREIYLKSKFSLKKNIIKLAELDEEKIKKDWNKENKIYLHMFCPSLSYLKENITQYLIYGKFIVF